MRNHSPDNVPLVIRQALARQSYEVAIRGCDDYPVVSVGQGDKRRNYFDADLRPRLNMPDEPKQKRTAPVAVMLVCLAAVPVIVAGCVAIIILAAIDSAINAVQGIKAWIAG
jgi:hypothetical protein